MLFTHFESLANNSKEELKKAPPPVVNLTGYRCTANFGNTERLLFPISKENTQPPPVYHPNPGESRLACQLTEEEQIRIAQRIGLIQHLPKGVFDPGSDSSEKKVKE